MRKFALYGSPGAGKSTLGGLLAQQFQGLGTPVTVVKVGAPLYELQAVVYAMAGRPMLAGGRQDGQLLNTLGGHMRRINPGALTDAFASRVAQAEREMPQAVLICDDLRAPDVGAVTALGFDLVQVCAPDELRRARKGGRGDLSPGAEDHPTEAPVTAVPRWRVDNDGTLQELATCAAKLVLEAGL
ncbi:hypothetical protein [Streptomyces sp. NPDC048496]|uniref:hypothetical protein n=1 Tax=Streptomyces sp. NPDC048496 TaxID=3365558 RepID=UPI003717E9D5